MSIMLVGLGVTMPVTASLVPVASQPLSLARMRRETTKEGNVDVSPSQMSSSGADAVAYVAALERKDRSKASEEPNGSKT